VVVLAAFALFTVLTGDDNGGPGPFSPVAAAAQKTANLPGARVRGTSTVSVEGMTMDVVMTGAYNGDTNRAAMEAEVRTNLPIPPGMTPMSTVQDGLTMYLTAPIFASQLPDGKTWMRMDLTEIVGNEDFQQYTTTDARAMLGQLGSEMQVTEVGPERIGRVQTTRYSVVVDSAAQAKAAREAGNDLAAELLEQNEGTSTSEVWIDDRGYVRRMTTSTPFAAVGNSGANMFTTVDFYDYGVRPDIQVPAESVTFDATEMAMEGLEAQLDG
jgi:hypothetical protein